MGLFSAMDAKTDKVDLSRVLNDHLFEVIVRACHGGLEMGLSLSALIRRLKAATPPRQRAILIGLGRELAGLEAFLVELTGAIQNARDMARMRAEELTLDLARK